ncbi:ArdC family protein [Sinorhizobium meliloti]|uniref:Antirestriction protein n=1 Tax=Rhizobium meliloti TaxID=382 RepID=A0A2J0YWY1_RHIML|nr:zincin-like metallopeptidase domain-containing protein [Sinorhizobium meliloti]PJR12796.1 antirestriction protein [Sinorhizobium meliloti]
MTSKARKPTSAVRRPDKDVYQRITDKIVEQLEAGVRPWHQPWGANGCATRPRRHNGVPYRGINTVLLWMEAAANGYGSPFWMTYKQSQELGGQVRKGEKSTLVVYAGAVERTEEDENGEDLERRIPFLKGYCVFNCDQIDGLPDQFKPTPVVLPTPKERFTHADEFFQHTGAEIRFGGNRAFYSPADDFIGMPVFEAFESPESYVSVLAHETAHWTKHPTRLDRDFGRKAWGDEGYAIEELVAEISSAMLCADLGIEDKPREDHAAYISSWLKVLKNEKRAVFQAAAHAERAVAFLHGLQPGASSKAGAPLAAAA